MRAAPFAVRAIIMTSTEDTIRRIIAARDATMRADLTAHVAIPTGHNHTAGLDEYRGIVTSRLEALGARTDLIAGDPRPDWLDSTARPSAGGLIPPTAVCRRPAEGPQHVLIAGHLDTVFDPEGSFQRLEADGDRAVGPGVVDMKGGILIALVALEALAEAGADLPWTFLLNSDEETGSFFSHRVLDAEARRCDYGIALEPALPDGSLAVARKGSGQFMIEVHGRSAHAGRDFDKGVSAVYAMAHTLTSVEAMSDLERGVTVNVGPLRGGPVTNAVPDHAMAWGNARFPDEDASQELQGRLVALQTGDDAMPRVIVHRIFNRPAKPLTPAVEELAGQAR
ncbi:MAG: M20/M25/M40 family metallo-hydrolase, partial [Planctomycetota bacterium]